MDTCRSLEKALRKLNIDTFLLELVEIITLELQKWEETPNMEQYEFVPLTFTIAVPGSFGLVC